MKYLMSIALLSLFPFSTQAASSSENFVGSSAIVSQILQKNLLGMTDYNSLLQAALERDHDTTLGDLTDCEPALGKFQCSMNIQGPGVKLDLEISFFHGEVVYVYIR